jgi:hypothetical protein
VAHGRPAPNRDAVLAVAVRETKGVERIWMAAELGDLRGPDGEAALLDILSEPNIGTDLACASMLALAKRSGPQRTPVWANYLKRRSPAIKRYAVLALAAAGDDRAWDDVFAYLSRMIRKPMGGPYLDTPVRPPIAYLARHAAACDGTDALRSLLRKRWSNLDPADRAWLRALWPEVDPETHHDDVPVPPDANAFLQWMRAEPIFGTVN